MRELLKSNGNNILKQLEKNQDQPKENQDQTKKNQGRPKNIMSELANDSL